MDDRAHKVGEKRNAMVVVRGEVISFNPINKSCRSRTSSLSTPPSNDETRSSTDRKLIA